MKIIEKNIDELKFLEENPRIDLNENDDEFKQLIASISYFGLQFPLLINKDNVVISGNQILKVLKYLYWKKVPCILTTVESSKQAFLSIAINKIKGEWDILKLKNLLTKNKNLIDKLMEIGFTKPEVDALKLIDKFPELKKKKQEKLTLF